MPSDFRQCKLCGKIYKYAGSFFCPTCVREVDKHFRTVKDFLYKKPNVTITEVAEQTGVDERIILYFLRDGRLEMNSAGDYLKCEACGAPITTGRVCSKCASGLTAAFEKAIQTRSSNLEKMEPRKPDQKLAKGSEASYARMHTDNYIEKNNRR